MDNSTIIKRALAIVVTLMAALGCDDEEPRYPVEPFIDNVTLSFIKGPFPGASDQLLLDLHIRDGDFDLGTNDVAAPYHPFYLFLDDHGSLVAVEVMPTEIDGEVIYNFDAQAAGTVGTFAQLRRTQENVIPYSCVDYSYLKVLATPDLVDRATANVIDTLVIEGDEMWLVADTFQILHNENHYNLSVDFLVEQANGEFAYVDLMTLSCGTFHGRFFPLDDLTVGDLVLSGPFTIQRTARARAAVSYSMQSQAFNAVFFGKKIKVRVSVKDRALNNSNTIETEAVLIQ
ncbi:MAG TPA: hypothetical protein VEB86_18370 [Chryseosolibacter sp.]|nr:hypothetical protein [Chryseosolibacter sp.]